MVIIFNGDKGLMDNRDIVPGVGACQLVLDTCKLSARAVDPAIAIYEVKVKLRSYCHLTVRLGHSHEFATNSTRVMVPAGYDNMVKVSVLYLVQDVSTRGIGIVTRHNESVSVVLLCQS